MFKQSCSAMDVVLICLWLPCIAVSIDGSQASQQAGAGTNFYCNCNGLGNAEVAKHLSQ